MPDLRYKVFHLQMHTRMIWILILLALFLFLSNKPLSASPPATSATSDNVTSSTIYKTASAVATPKEEAPKSTVAPIGGITGYQYDPPNPITPSPSSPPPIWRIPPLGYNGPVGGPYKNNAGDVSLGLPVKQAPDGYGYDLSHLSYQWIGVGMPPNGKFTISFYENMDL
jgi:hypothetical protein